MGGHEKFAYGPCLNVFGKLKMYSYLTRQKSCEIGSGYIIFLLTGLRIYAGKYKAQGPTLYPTERRALRGPLALHSPV